MSHQPIVSRVAFGITPYWAWTQGKCNQARFDTLLNAICDWNLFLAFNIIDGCTVGKSREPLRWLFREVEGKVQSSFTAADILPGVEESPWAEPAKF